MKKENMIKVLFLPAAAFVSCTLLLFAAATLFSDKKKLIKKLSSKISPYIAREDYPFLEELADLLIKYHFVHKVIFKTEKKQILRSKDIHTTSIKIFIQKLYYKNKEIGLIEIAYG